PNQGQTSSGRAVSFASAIDGEIGVPSVGNGYMAGIGSCYVMPIVANLRDGQRLQSLNFVAELTPQPASSRLDKTDLQVLPMSTSNLIQVLPASTTPPSNPVSRVNNGVNSLLIAYPGNHPSFRVTNGFATVALLGIQFRPEDAFGN